MKATYHGYLYGLLVSPCHLLQVLLPLTADSTGDCLTLQRGSILGALSDSADHKFGARINGAGVSPVLRSLHAILRRWGERIAVLRRRGQLLKVQVLVRTY